MLIGFDVVLLMPAPVGTAPAVSETFPRIEGFHVQVATIFGELPLVDLFLHPGNTLPLILNVTFDATETFAVTTTAVRKAAVVAEPARASELKAEVSTTFVTVIVIDCVPAFAAASVAVRVMS